jgi:hypothetical protein
MSGKKIKGIAGIFISLIVLVFAAYFFIFSKIMLKPVTEAPREVPTPTVQVLKEWKDQSEFMFQYPAELDLNPHEEDKDNYAHIELTKGSSTSGVVLWTKDASDENIKEYAKAKKISNFLDTELDGYEAIKWSKDGEGQKFIFVETIRNGYLYQIELRLPSDTTETESGYWSGVFDRVISTYKFIENAEKKESVENSGSEYSEPEVSYDDEEVIE